MTSALQYANFGLWVGSLLSDGEVFKYTFPEVQLIKGHVNGGAVGGWDFGDYARHLNLFHVNDLIGSQHDLKEFYAHRKRIGDWMHNGEFQDKRRTDGEPAWHRRQVVPAPRRAHVGAAVNIHNEDRIDGALLRLQWPELRSVSKAFAYLWGGKSRSCPYTGRTTARPWLSRQRRPQRSCCSRRHRRAKPFAATASGR